MKKTIKNANMTAIALSACLGPVAAQADANFYGIISPTMVDRDSAASVSFQDYGFAPSRIGFTISQDIDNDLKVGADLEVNAGSGDTYTKRKASVNVAGNFGTVELGYGYSATFVMDSVDASGTWWADPMGWLNQFAATGSPSFIPDHTAKTTLFNDHLLYTSPNLSGFQVKVQIGDNASNDDSDSNAIEILVTYGGNGITARFFTIDNGVSDSDPINGILVGYQFPMGFNATYQSTSQDDSTNSNEDEFSGFKLGYSKDRHHFSYSTSTIDNGGGTDYDRNALTYQMDVNDMFKVWAQISDEEFGDLSDDAVAIGTAVFF